MRRSLALVVVFGITLALAATGAAKNISGGRGNDILIGTAKADRLNGRGGNDRIFGRGGADVLIGAAGNDILEGGAGRDSYRCGAGNDHVVAQPGDVLALDCETVAGLPGVSIADTSSLEGNSGRTAMTFQLTLSQSIAFPVRVRYQTVDGSARAPSDYSAAAGEVVFSPGQRLATIVISIVGDGELEPDETFGIVIGAPVNAGIATRQATGVIRNDDAQRPRAGRYTGTTSQNKPVEFIVSSDLSQITELAVLMDIECPSVGFQANDILLTASGVPIQPNTWRFEVVIPLSGVTGTWSMTGALSPNGASGNMRLDFEVSGIRCTSNNVPWSAR